MAHLPRSIARRSGKQPGVHKKSGYPLFRTNPAFRYIIRRQPAEGLYCKALCMSPKFLFVSEPTRGIDIGAKKLVLETLVRLNRELGMTVVIVSSELQELKSVSDRIAIVSEGKLVDILSPQASDADYGLAMSGIKPSEHTEKGGTEE